MLSTPTQSSKSPSVTTMLVAGLEKVAIATVEVPVVVVNAEAKAVLVPSIA